MLLVLCFFLLLLLSWYGIDLDFLLLVGCLVLFGFGLVMVIFVFFEVVVVQLGNLLYFFVCYLIYLVIGLIFCGLIMMVLMVIWQCWGWKLLLVVFGLLVLVIIFGIGCEVNGLMCWIGFGLFNIQFLEIVKVCVVIFMVGYLICCQQEVWESWMGFFKFFVVLLLMVGLLLCELDFGVIVVMMGVVVVMLFFGGVGLFCFGLMVLLVVGVVVLLIQIQFYWMVCLINFIDFWVDQFGVGYQLSQVLIVFGCGGWLGMGLGNSIQKQFYLLEVYIDFVFVVFVEELGIVGVLVIVVLFVFVSLCVLYIGIWVEQVKQFFFVYVVYGLVFFWIGQFLINIGVNVGLLLIKGLILLFFSYGGSLLVICCVCLGMLLCIEWEW